MWAARSPLEERVLAARHMPVPATDARRRRACVERSRPSLSLWWLVAGSSREREGATSSFFLGRSLAPLVCKKGRVCIRTH